VPTVAEAIDLVHGRVCLVDGTITPCWSYAENDELWSRKHGTTGFNAQLVYLLDGAAIYISDPLPGCTHDAKGILPPRRSPRLSRTPVAGSWIKAQRHQRWRSDSLCAATERVTLRTRACARRPMPDQRGQMAGRSRTSTGQHATMLPYEEGSPSTGGSDSGAQRSASASTRYVTPTLPRRLRMPPRRHKTGWPYVDPNPLGTLRQSRTAWGLQLTPGPVMADGRYGGRPGSDPAGNPPLPRCIRSPIRCSVWMRRQQTASSGKHPERRERLRNTKCLATRPGQQARARAV